MSRPTRLVARLATLGLAASAVVLGALPASAGFSCHGTEPFWGLNANRGIVFSDPNEGDVRYPAATMTRKGGLWTYKAGGPARPKISVAIRAANGTCSDGMSDTLYPFSVTVSVQGRSTKRGCCTKW